MHVRVREVRFQKQSPDTQANEATTHNNHGSDLRNMKTGQRRQVLLQLSKVGQLQENDEVLECYVGEALNK
jgi:hypothetical protein